MKRLTLILLLLTMTAITLHADLKEFDQLSKLSLEQAKELALKHNSAYEAKHAALEGAKWSRQSALAALLPSASLSATLLYTDPATRVSTGSQSYTLNRDMRTLSLNLSQPLFLGGKLYQAYKISRTSEEIARLGYQAQRSTLLAETESKYLSVLQLMEVYRLSQSELESAKTNLEIAQLKLENGLISQADYLRFQSALAAKEVSDLQAYTALQLAIRDFGNYLGDSELRVPMELSPTDYALQIEALAQFGLAESKNLSDRAMQVALQRNLGLKTLDKTQELSERAFKIAKAAWLPTLMLTGSRQYKENGLDRYEFDPANQLMLSFILPILPGLGNYAGVRKAKEDMRKAALENKTATDGIKLGLEASTLSLISAARQSRSALLSKQYNEQLYAQLQERFKLNMLSVKELLDAELMLSAATLNYNTALFGFLKARNALMQNLNLESSQELSQILNLQ